MICLINYLVQVVKFLVLSLFQSNQMIKNFQLKKYSVFKFNDLKSKVSFVAFRVEGIKFQLRKKLKLKKRA